MMSVVRETERERYRDNGERERKGVITRKIEGFVSSKNKSSKIVKER